MSKPGKSPKIGDRLPHDLWRRRCWRCLRKLPTGTFVRSGETRTTDVVWGYNRWWHRECWRKHHGARR